MKRRETALTTLFLIICIIIFFIYTPFSEDKFYKAIPTNTAFFFEQQNIGSQIDEILQSYPIKYFADPYINQKDVKAYRENKKLMWLLNKIISKKTAVGFSKHTGKTGEECIFAILQINSIQQIAKIVLTFHPDKNLVKSKTDNNQNIWTTKIDNESELNFTFSDGMLILTISKSTSSIERMLKQLSDGTEALSIIQAVNQLKEIPSQNRGFYFPPYPHSKVSKTLFFSTEKFSADETHINIYTTDDLLVFETLKASDISNMLETINYYPTCFIAGTPNFFTTIFKRYINIPENIAITLQNMEAAPTFIASSSQKYSGKILKLKTPSIIVGTQISEQQKEQLIANIIKNFSTPQNQIYLTKENNNSNINIFTTANDKNKYAQQPNTDKISFASKNQLTIFSTAYSPLNKIISKPPHNLYKTIDIPEESIAFAILDIPKSISLIEEYLDVYAIYLIVSSDKQTNRKRSTIDNQIKPVLNKIKIPGTITTTVTTSTNTPYKIEIKIMNK
jgi:hypothetical protein